jgi:hypothetical protein
MTDAPEGRPKPSPRPRPSARPSPRPRVAGSRRDQKAADGAEPTVVQDAVPAEAATGTADRPAAIARPSKATARPRTARASTATASDATTDVPRRRRASALVLALALLCLAAAGGVAVLGWQRLNPTHVDSEVFAATRSGVEALYAYDYRDSEGSVSGKLAVLTGDLREQYEADLSQGGIVDTYEQVSATTSYEVLDVGLQQINKAQDTATLVVFGEYVVESVNSGDQPAPEGSECRVTAEGAQSCTQTVQVGMVDVDGEWKINELTLLTTS